MRLLMLLLKSTQSSPEMCKASCVMAVMAKLKVQIVMKTSEYVFNRIYIYVYIYICSKEVIIYKHREQQGKQAK